MRDIISLMSFMLIIIKWPVSTLESRKKTLNRITVKEI